MNNHVEQEVLDDFEDGLELPESLHIKQSPITSNPVKDAFFNSNAHSSDQMTPERFNNVKDDRFYHKIGYEFTGDELDDIEIADCAIDLTEFEEKIKTIKTRKVI